MSPRALRLPLAIGVGLTLGLRAAWSDAALARDEGGLLLLARAWDPGEPFPYGPYFLDRPPVLVLLDGSAGTREIAPPPHCTE